MPAKKQVPREKILSSALRILKEKGFDALNIKQLAKEAGCSTQPVYLSFSGMDELREELIFVAINEFENFMKSESKDGKIRLYDIDYIRFAKSEPRLFCFLFMRPGSFSEIKRVLLPIIDWSVGELSEAYRISRNEADFLHDNLWMHAHGIASMIATEFCEWNMEKAKFMLDDCKQAFVKKYE